MSIQNAAALTQAQGRSDGGDPVMGLPFVSISASIIEIIKHLMTVVSDSNDMLPGKATKLREVPHVSGFGRFKCMALPKHIGKQ